MTQTKIKGWCPWHKNGGYRWQGFTDDVDDVNEWRCLAHALGEFPGGNRDAWNHEIGDHLKALGWEIRECYLTIEDI